MGLQYLEFDLLEDSGGLRSWDALASPLPAHTPALLAEVRALLLELQRQLGPAGALDEGHRWDMDLQIHDESGTPLTLAPPPTPGQRITLALCLSGHEALAERLSALNGP